MPRTSARNSSERIEMSGFVKAGRREHIDQTFRRERRL
jgi:hypothetical protein